MMEEFWELVGRNVVAGERDIAQALDDLKSRLEGAMPYELVDFARTLRALLFDLDLEVLASIDVKLSDGRAPPQSLDHFLYSRCTCILAGRDAYLECLSSPSAFAKYNGAWAGSCERLLYIVPDIYREKVGADLVLSDAFPVETGSNPAGWR